jgi:histone deacetylase 1/2
MENANSPEYLEKIKNQLVENLRRTAHAPSVQMQDVPRHSMGAMSDEEEAELDDLDEDENKDVRMTERRWDQRIERDNEYEESDAEDIDKVNGVHRGAAARKGFTDYRNSDAEAESGAATPANGSAEQVIKSKESEDVVMEDAAEEKISQPEPAPEPAAEATAPSPSATEKPKRTDEETEAAGIAEQEEALKEAQESSKPEESGAEPADNNDSAVVKDQDESSKSDQPVPTETEKPTEDEPTTTKEADSSSKDDAPQPEKRDKDGDVDMAEAPTEATTEAPTQVEDTKVKEEEPAEKNPPTDAAEPPKEKGSPST